MKKIILMLVLFMFVQNPTTAENFKIENIGLNGNKITIKTKIKDKKITLKTPKLSKNKYLKMINIVI